MAADGPRRGRYKKGPARGASGNVNEIVSAMGKSTRRRDPDRARSRFARGPDGTLLLSLSGGIIAVLVCAGGVARWLYGG